jgi:argininosuccinate lyase
MAYNRDLQEDKQRVFDTVDTVRASVRLCAAMLNHTEATRDVCRAAASDPALLATELADYLVRKGVPFRQAHHTVGELVAVAEGLGKKLNRVTIQELQLVDERFGPDALEAFDLERALANRTLPGSPGTDQVRRQIAAWQEALRKMPGSSRSGRASS